MTRKFDPNYYQNSHPKLSPSWRFDRVQQLIASSRPPHARKDDQLVKGMYKYYRAKERLRGRFDDKTELARELAGRYTYMWAADTIYESGRDHRTRYELEALILAKSESKVIEERFGFCPDTVKYYELAFFNVKPRLQNRSYIASSVLAPAFMAGLPSRTLELTAKYFGYFAGIHALNLVLDAFTAEITPPQEPSEISNWLDREFRSRIRASAMIGISFLEPTNYNIRTLLESYQSLLSLQYREQSTAGEDNVINRAIQQFVQVNPMQLGDDADQLPPRPGPMIALGAVEPRVSELEKLARGETVDALNSYSDWQNPYTEDNPDAKANDEQDSE